MQKMAQFCDKLHSPDENIHQPLTLITIALIVARVQGMYSIFIPKTNKKSTRDNNVHRNHLSLPFAPPPHTCFRFRFYWPNPLSLHETDFRNKFLKMSHAGFVPIP
jgi:hypothetical protein